MLKKDADRMPTADTLKEIVLNLSTISSTNDEAPILKFRVKANLHYKIK